MSLRTDREVINVALEAGVKLRLRRLARLEGCSMAEIVRRLIEVGMPVLVEKSRARLLDDLQSTEGILHN